MTILTDIINWWVALIGELTPSDFIQALGLPISIGVAWLAFRLGAKDLRRSLIITDVADQIKSVTEEIRSYVDVIETHYLGKYTDGFTVAKARESQKRIGGIGKCISDKLDVLSVFLNKKAREELNAAYNKWHSRALGDPYPVLRKEDAVKDFDVPVRELKAAQSELERYLAVLRKDCIKDGLRCGKITRI